MHHIRIASGVDDADVAESVSKEFGALVRGGMTTLGALQAATITTILTLSCHWRVSPLRRPSDPLSRSLRRWASRSARVLNRADALDKIVRSRLVSMGLVM